MKHEDKDSYEKIMAEMREWQAAPWDESPPLTIWADRIEALNRAQGWRPIETWPDDYSLRLASVGGTVVAAFMDVTGQLNQQTPDRRWKKLRQKPTHWMPLPAAPDKEEGQ